MSMAFYITVTLPLNLICLQMTILTHYRYFVYRLQITPTKPW